MHKQKHMETTNPYIVKKIVAVEEVIKVEKEIDVIDWDSVPSGTYMTGRIKGNFVEGVLAKEDDYLYFCQNSHNGDNAKFKFGFIYSWSFSQKGDGTLSQEVSDIQFPPKPDNVILPLTPIMLKIGDYNSYVFADKIVVGCQTISKEKVQKVLAAMEELSKSIEKTK